MTRELESTFRELGLAQYLDSFVDQGFDTWDTILDIQESDLDALGVKLGHRRKLQRRIANARGIAPSLSLSSPKPNSEDGKRNGARSNQARSETASEGTGVVKRKYRRHPKPDENAPERPPSAYVLFSNKMREDLKGHNLTFTEIAKLVGENWQSLPPAEKEAYESQANAAKERYHRDLAEYKKTAEFRKYAQYLQEFKEKQAKQNHADVHKRTKIEPARVRHGSTSSSAATGGTISSVSTRDSGSSCERMQGSEPPPTRQERHNSIGSAALDELAISSRVAAFDTNGGRRVLLQDGGRSSGGIRPSPVSDGGRQHLPSLSDMLDDNRSLPPSSSDGNSYTRPGFVPASGLHPGPERAPIIPPPARTPLLAHVETTTGSLASSTSTFGRPSPGDGQLPIHALLSNRGVPQPPQSPLDQANLPRFTSSPSPMDPDKPPFGGGHGPRGYGFQSAPSALQHMKFEQANGGDVVMTSPGSVQPPAAKSSSGKPGLDGMSALLRAGEIVDRQGE